MLTLFTSTGDTRNGKVNSVNILEGWFP